MKLLVVEDDVKILKSIKKGLEQESYVVDVALDGASGYDLALSEDYDVVILDLMLPKMNGIEVCTKLRKENISTPILMLTALGNLGNKVTGLDSGADDYLTKPFAFEELLARIRALLRRPTQTISNILGVSDLTLDRSTQVVTRNGVEISLTKKEYSLLEYLLLNKSKVISKDQLMAQVWSFNSDILPNTVEVYIRYLRNKVEKPFPKAKPIIKTIRGFGYKID